MSKKINLDTKIFNLKEDTNEIAHLYPAHQAEIRRFLTEENSSRKLQGLSVQQVYEVISKKLGHPVPQ